MVTKTTLLTEEHWYWNRTRFWDEPITKSYSRLNYVKRNLSNTVDHGPNKPNYKRLIALAADASTYLRGSETKVFASSDMTYYSSYKDKFGTGAEFQSSGCFSTFTDVPSNPGGLDLSQAKNAAIKRFNQRAIAAMQSMQALVAAGELGETGKMLGSHGRNIKRGVTGYIQDLDRKIFKGGFRPRQALRDLSGRWLEFVFGIQPLISDVDAALEGLLNLRYRSPRIRISGSGSSDRVVSSSPFSISLNHGGLIGFLKIKKQSVRYRLDGCVSINPNIPDYRREFGLTLSEFVPTLWELMPYSFLVDYITNIGDIIDALRYQRSNINWVCYGFEQKERIFSEPTTFKPGTNPDPNRFEFVCRYRPSSEEYSVESRIVERDSFHESLVPSLEFEIPGMGTKWVNMAALTAQFVPLQKRVRASA